MNRTTAYLDVPAEAYGARGEAQRRAGRMHSRLRFAKVDEVFQSGLHEFITEFIDTNAALGDEIARQYLS